MEGGDSLQVDAVPSLPVDEPSGNEAANQRLADANQDQCSAPEQFKDTGLVTLVFADDDAQLANDIMDEMKTIIDANVLLHNDEFFNPDIVERPVEICTSSTVVFIIHTENTTNDLVAKFTKNEAIAHLRIQEGRDNIRSLCTAQGLRPLTGLASMQTLDWYKASKGKQLQGIIKYARKTERNVSSKMEALSLQPEEERYKMTAEPRGHCYIFSNKVFESKTNRIGTEKDRDELKGLFEKLKFKVCVFDDTKADDIRDKVEELSKQSHSQYDCVVLIFLTHGSDGVIFGSDNDRVYIEHLIDFFKGDKCPSLADKPKLFFFGSCRGTKFPIAVKSEDDSEANDDFGQEVIKLVAPEAHFFIGYATVRGKKALRNDETGSWYIQALIKVFDTYAHSKDFASMMTDVHRELHDRECETLDGDFYKQVADSSDRLLKKLYF